MLYMCNNVATIALVKKKTLAWFDAYTIDFHTLLFSRCMKDAQAERFHAKVCFH